MLLVGTVGSFGSSDRFADPAHAASQLQPVTSLAPLQPIGSGSNARVSSTVTAPRSPTANVPPVRRPDLVTVAPTTVAAPAPDAPEPGDVAVVTTPTRPVRVLVVGDSTAWSVGDGLVAWAEANPELASVTLTVSPGCGFVLDGRVPADDGSDYAAECDVTLSQWMNTALDELRPDLVMLMATRTDVKDREWSPDEGPLTILDPRARERIRSDYADVTEWILGAGAPEVVWIEPPVVRVDPAPPDEMTDPKRIAALHAIIRDTTAGASDPMRVTSVDLSGWYAESRIDDREARPDGMHFEVDGAAEVADRFLGPTLVNVALGA